MKKLLLIGVFCMSSTIVGLSLSSLDFKNDGTIPKEFTGDGQDKQPCLVWSSVPKETKSFAVICDDPDAPAGTWVHWVVYNIPGDKRSTDYIKKGEKQMADGTLQGMNSWPHIGYNGPLPPKSHGTHHYHFKLYALDTLLPLKAGATKEELLKAMKGHILAQAEIVGLYAR